MPGLPTPLFFNGQVSPGFGTCQDNCTLSLKLVPYFPSELGWDVEREVKTQRTPIMHQKCKSRASVNINMGKNG